MRLIYLALFMAFAMPYTFAQTSPKPVTVTSSIINTTPETPMVLRFHFLNPFQKNGPSVKLRPGEQSAVSGEMLFTQNMTVQYNNTFINLYVAPGDSVHLTIDAALLKKPDFAWLTITGDHARISTQLNKCHHYLSTLPYKQYDYTLSASNMRLAIKSDYERYLAALNTYAEKHQLDPVVMEFSKRDIMYSISNWMSDYVRLGSPETSQRMERIKIFSDPTLFDIYNPANFQTMMFPYHLDYYASWITQADSLVAQAIEEKRPQDVIKTGVAVLLKEPAGVSRDYMVYSFLSRLTSKHPALLDEMPEISSYFTQPLYYNYLKKTVFMANTVAFPETAIAGVHYLTDEDAVQPLPATDVFSYLAKKYPGKVLYIDVYATWCTPCLAEMKFVPALHEALKKEDVVFVNLCLQSEQVNWKKLLKETGIKGENYFFDEEASKLFMGAYRLSGYPSYLLVNKQGKIVTTQAPRPSDNTVLTEAISRLSNAQ